MESAGRHTARVDGNFHESSTGTELLLVSYAETIFEVLIFQGGRLVFLVAFLLGVPTLVVRQILARGAGSRFRPEVVQTLVTLGAAGALAVTVASLAVPNFRA